MEKSIISDLRPYIRGQIIGREDEEYEQARKVYNAMISRRPLAIVRCADSADVTTAVKVAADRGLEIAVRGGSHSVPGFGTCDDGIVIDLSRMKGTWVDPQRRLLRAQAGCTWGDVDHATHAFGLATPGGIISSTGVAGLTLGGGIGHLSRAHGLSCDNLVAADVVTADGRIVKANDEQNQDLFWALRGGGGNFGVVTSFDFRLHPVGLIYGGPMFFSLDDAERVMRAYRDYIAEAPERLGAFFGFQIAPPLPFIPSHLQGKPLCMVVACWNGSAADGEKALAPVRSAARPVAEHLGVMPYPALNSAFDALLPAGMQHYWKAAFVPKLADEAIAAHRAHGPQLPALQSTMHLYPINGAAGKVPVDATAFAFRGSQFACVIAGMWPDAADNEKNVRWVRAYYDAIRPYAADTAYVNFMAADDQHLVGKSYGPNLPRLQAIKRKYDPTNLFHLNQNIRPAA